MTMAVDGLRLTGAPLTSEQVEAVARHGRRVSIDPEALAAVDRARELLEPAIRDVRPITESIRGSGP